MVLVFFNLIPLRCNQRFLKSEALQLSKSRVLKTFVKKTTIYQYKFTLHKLYNEKNHGCNFVVICKRFLLTCLCRVMYTDVEGLLL